MLVESGGDNLAVTFSRELADLTIYVIDVAVSWPLRYRSRKRLRLTPCSTHRNLHGRTPPSCAAFIATQQRTHSCLIEYPSTPEVRLPMS